MVKDGEPVGARFEPTDATDPKRPTPEVLLALSERVRKGELFAFLVIPKDVLEAPDGKPATIRYYSNSPTDRDLRNWLQFVLSDEVRARRFQKAGIDTGMVAKLSQPVTTEDLGLLSRSQPAAGEAGTAAKPAAIEEAQKVDPVRTFGPPIALMFVMFIVIMTTTPQLMQTVLEEKMSKISEVLLGSITPFELMMGKLLGNVGVALLLAGLYVGAAYGAAAHYGYGDIMPPSLLAAAVLFIVLGVTLFGSLFMAVGSACNELKDAQSLMFPVMMLALLPTFFWSVVLTKPSSPIAVGVSLFPPATPFLMLMRMALQPSPPAWQVLLSIVLTTATAVVCIWAAGKIFRVGLLMQGKAPTFATLARWVLGPLRRSGFPVVRAAPTELTLDREEHAPDPNPGAEPSDADHRGRETPDPAGPRRRRTSLASAHRTLRGPLARLRR